MMGDKVFCLLLVGCLCAGVLAIPSLEDGSALLEEMERSRLALRKAAPAKDPHSGQHPSPAAAHQHKAGAPAPATEQEAIENTKGSKSGKSDKDAHAQPDKAAPSKAFHTVHLNPPRKKAAPPVVEVHSSEADDDSETGDSPETMSDSGDEDGDHESKTQTNTEQQPPLELPLFKENGLPTGSSIVVVSSHELKDDSDRGSDISGSQDGVLSNHVDQDEGERAVYREVSGAAPASAEQDEAPASSSAGNMKSGDRFTDPPPPQALHGDGPGAGKLELPLFADDGTSVEKANHVRIVDQDDHVPPPEVDRPEKSKLVEKKVTFETVYHYPTEKTAPQAEKEEQERAPEKVSAEPAEKLDNNAQAKPASKAVERSAEPAAAKPAAADKHADQSAKADSKPTDKVDEKPAAASDAKKDSAADAKKAPPANDKAASDGTGSVVEAIKKKPMSASAAGALKQLQESVEKRSGSHHPTPKVKSHTKKDAPAKAPSKAPAKKDESWHAPANAKPADQPVSSPAKDATNAEENAAPADANVPAPRVAKQDGKEASAPEKPGDVDDAPIAADDKTMRPAEQIVYNVPAEIVSAMPTRPTAASGDPSAVQQAAAAGAAAAGGPVDGKEGGGSNTTPGVAGTKLDDKTAVPAAVGSGTGLTGGKDISDKSTVQPTITEEDGHVVSNAADGSAVSDNKVVSSDTGESIHDDSNVVKPQIVDGTPAPVSQGGDKPDAKATEDAKAKDGSDGGTGGGKDAGAQDQMKPPEAGGDSDADAKPEVHKRQPDLPFTAPPYTLEDEHELNLLQAGLPEFEEESDGLGRSDSVRAARSALQRSADREQMVHAARSYSRAKYATRMKESRKHALGLAVKRAVIEDKEEEEELLKAHKTNLRSV